MILEIVIVNIHKTLMVGEPALSPRLSWIDPLCDMVPWEGHRLHKKGGFCRREGGELG